MDSRLFMVILLLQALISSPGIVCENEDFTTSQAVSWSDDFEDGNYDDWITFGGAYQEEKLPSNFTIIDGALFGQEESFNHAFHDKTGIHCFDLKSYWIDNATNFSPSSFYREVSGRHQLLFQFH